MGCRYPCTVTSGGAAQRDSVDAVRAGLADHEYLADEGLATSIFLALRLQRPLLLEGEAGVGKTEVAKVLARWTGGELVRLQCYEGIDVSQAVYEWDYSRQLLHLRAVEASHREVIEDELYSERFLVKRPLLRALAHDAAVSPVLLIDEVDRADDEFEAFLLEILSDWSISVPELGVVHASVPPIAILTSNRTRDVHDALKRRCLYHWIAHPDFERELAIVRLRAPRVSDVLARDVAAAVEVLRDLELYKAPGVAETIDWAEAVATLGNARLDERAVDATLGTILKYREDQERVRGHGLAAIVQAAVSRDDGGATAGERSAESTRVQRDDGGATAGERSAESTRVQRDDGGATAGERSAESTRVQRDDGGATAGERSAESTRVQRDDGGATAGERSAESTRVQRDDGGATAGERSAESTRVQRDDGGATAGERSAESTHVQRAG